MSKYAIAKIFMDTNDLIVTGDTELVDKYINDLYESKCLMKDDVEFDEEEYYNKCEYCESLMSEGGRQECPVLVTSHEINLSEEDCEDTLNDYRKDMPWAEVVSLH